MASQRIRVMLSSRCLDRIRTAAGGQIPLSDVRRRIKQEIENTKLFGRDTFECWVHEDEPALAAGADFWDRSMEAVRRADIVLVLYNGDAGFVVGQSDIGICHAELAAALGVAGERVRLVNVQQANVGPAGGDAVRNGRFQDYVTRLSIGMRFAENDDQAVILLLEALQDSVVQMVRQGSATSRKGRFDTGAPLDWSRLDFAARKSEMEAIVRERLANDGGEILSDGAGVVRKVGDVPVCFCCHAVPAAMTVPAAREMVGRPFLRDHELIGHLGEDVAGPVHIIACHKGVTENQAAALLGFPDATIVTPPFGVYVADNTQKIQLVFLANCRDESSTRYSAQRFFDWLLQSGESAYLAERARGRAAIVRTIASQMKRERSPARGESRSVQSGARKSRVSRGLRKSRR